MKLNWLSLTAAVITALFLRMLGQNILLFLGIALLAFSLFIKNVSVTIGSSSVSLFTMGIYMVLTSIGFNYKFLTLVVLLAVSLMDPDSKILSLPFMSKLPGISKGKSNMTILPAARSFFDKERPLKYYIANGLN